jgi:hypothetical protein
LISFLLGGGQEKKNSHHSNCAAKSDLLAKNQSKAKKESESFNFADTNAV